MLISYFRQRMTNNRQEYIIRKVWLRGIICRISHHRVLFYLFLRVYRSYFALISYAFHLQFIDFSSKFLTFFPFLEAIDQDFWFSLNFQFQSHLFLCHDQACPDHDSVVVNLSLWSASWPFYDIFRQTLCRVPSKVITPGMLAINYK